MKQGKIYEVGKCICDSCLATEALKLILETDDEGGEKNSPEEKRLVFGGLQSDEFRISISIPRWKDVKVGLEGG